MFGPYVSQQTALLAFQLVGIVVSFFAIVPYNCRKGKSKKRGCGGVYNCRALCRSRQQTKLKNKKREAAGKTPLDYDVTRTVYMFLTRRTMEGWIVFFCNVGLVIITSEKFFFQAPIDDRDMTTPQYQAALSCVMHFYIVAQIALNMVSKAVPREEEEQEAIDLEKRSKHTAAAAAAATAAQQRNYFDEWAQSPWLALVFMLWALFNLGVEIYGASCNDCTTFAIATMRHVSTIVPLAYLSLGPFAAIVDYCANFFEEDQNGSHWVWFFVMQFFRMGSYVLISVFMWFTVTSWRNPLDHTKPVGLGDSTTQRFEWGIYTSNWALSLCLFISAMETAVALIGWNTKEEVSRKQSEQEKMDEEASLIREAYKVIKDGHQSKDPNVKKGVLRNTRRFIEMTGTAPKKKKPRGG